MFNDKNKNKTRDLSYFKFLDILQSEYILAELRKKIYPSLSDKNYYERVMKGKKEKIEDIAIRNSLKTIFNDKETKIKKYKEIYNDQGYPNFFYRNEEDRLNNEIKDKRNYYMIGSEVKVFSINGGEEKIGKIDSISFKTMTAKIEFEDINEINIFDLNLVTRIL